ncbi:arginase [Candidatus Bathyarchaeota archaeon]|nr:arginase [Candidatus Bathyarchaeota archaeon]
MKTLTPSLSRIGVIGIPYNTGSKGLSIERGAEALRNAGIVDALRRFSEVVDFGDISVNLPAPDCSDPKLLNPDQVEILCRALADKVKAILDAGCLPFIVGGDDSALMGVIEGLRRSLGPKIGMVYMDAHGDFNTPETTPSGIIGGMDVAIVAGRGPKKLAAMFEHSPLLPEENIVLHGVRDLDPLEAKALAESKVRVYTREKIKSQGAEKTAEEILRYLESKCDCLYLHIDLDVLDKSVFSAQGLPVPDGLSKEEFQSTLKVLVKSGKLCGVALMVFDAAKDADGNQAKRIVELVTGTLFNL